MCSVRFAATDATRDGTSEDARRAGDAVCSGDCEMEQVLFSARGLEASWVNSGSFLIADGGSRGRAGEKSDDAGGAREWDRGANARAGVFFSGTRGRRTEIMLQSAEKPTRRLVRLGRQSVSSLRARRRRSHCARVSDGRTEARFIRPRSIRSIPRRRQRERTSRSGGGSRIGDARGVAVASRSSRRVHRGRSDPIETRRRNPSGPRRAEGDCGRRRFIELTRFLGERAVGAP